MSERNKKNREKRQFAVDCKRYHIRLKKAKTCNSQLKTKLIRCRRVSLLSINAPSIMTWSHRPRPSQWMTFNQYIFHQRCETHKKRKWCFWHFLQQAVARRVIYFTLLLMKTFFRTEIITRTRLFSFKLMWWTAENESSCRIPLLSFYYYVGYVVSVHLIFVPAL